MHRNSFSGPPLPSKPLEYTPAEHLQHQQQQMQQSRDKQYYPAQAQIGSYYDDHQSERFFRERLQNVHLSSERVPQSYAEQPLPRPRSAIQYNASQPRYATQQQTLLKQPLVEPFDIQEARGHLHHPQQDMRERRMSTGQRTSPSRTPTNTTINSSASSLRPLSVADAGSSVRTNETAHSKSSSKASAGRITRKPVVLDVEMAPTRPLRKYHSPDDLDRLIPRKEANSGAYVPRPLPSELRLQQKKAEQRPYPNASSQSTPRALSPIQTQFAPRNLPTSPHTSDSYSSLPRQSPHSAGYQTLTMPTSPMEQQRLAGFRPRTPQTTSPPSRQNSIPLQMPMHPSLLKSQSSPEAFFPHAQLRPQYTVRPGSISPERGEQIRMTRSTQYEDRRNSTSFVPSSVNSLPSPPTHSPQMPEPLYRHPISELESYYQGRIPSPDRSTRFPDTPYEYDVSSSPVDEIDRQATVPPEIQARRGRQRGEVLIESDLPAMPPLFEAPPALQPLPPTSGPVRHLPSASQAGLQQSPVVPLSPKKQSSRDSMRMEHDPLQSIKVLPVEPVKRPALCLEERFHPTSFAKSSKLKVKVRVGQVPFVAGGEIFGYLEISSDEGFRAALGSTQVLVGEIGVEVLGCEEISHPETGHEPRSLTFLFGKKVFQDRADMHPSRSGQQHVVTSAVTLMPPPDADGYRQPSKGTTGFPFAFVLPVDAPSSADLGIARIRYTVTGYVTVKLQGSFETIATSLPVRVVEAWDMHNPVYNNPVEASQGRDIANYNEVYVNASLPKSLFLEGDEMYGHIRIANHGARKVREVKFYLMNRLTFFGDKRQHAREVNPADDWSIDSEAVSIAEPHLITKGSENTWQFKLEVPEDKCLTIRNTALFEVTPFVLVKISTGPLFKSIKVALPSICIADRASMIEDTQVAPTHRSGGKVKFLVPNLYKFQRIINGEPQLGQMGGVETSDLMTYVDAHARVQALS
ncbi:hypothetical protein BCR37DRAFT_248635 [Protomyces lactucae-debilis]|uniref:Arrestin C-terminal-like domain-containing protein n=1 Tax=Protomyces lactucae-debilis TaxID=2754530 RepID=A0A1Y2FP00_PROLT|nr:uncharacterized protein BCR37DRAFT_248635 [Protomyces lactucae-debilis]ORY85732.1 hypothetical protein BCR37DRAFT_248635 [Protomyces lactucae-debilis]